MKAMPIPKLQDEGLLFLWVTGRAMELGRECMQAWGYAFLFWFSAPSSSPDRRTVQIYESRRSSLGQNKSGKSLHLGEGAYIRSVRILSLLASARYSHRSNRTLVKVRLLLVFSCLCLPNSYFAPSHTKEHMLVGIKTLPSPTADPNSTTINWPKWINRGLDTDVIVSEVRETSRKPDEVYGIIERMCPGGRKIEIFGRRHNTRPGWVFFIMMREKRKRLIWLYRWITLGNQLGCDMIHEPELAERIQARWVQVALLYLCYFMFLREGYAN